MAASDVDGTNLAPLNTDATKDLKVFAASIFYLGETVWSTGDLAVLARVLRTEMVKVPVKEHLRTTASKGVNIAAMDGDLAPANTMGNLGTVTGGIGDTSMGTTVLPTV